MTWRALAQCADTPLDALFPETYDLSATAICDGCPVAAECAAERGDLPGVWGGELHGFNVRPCRTCGRIVTTKGRHRVCITCRRSA